VRRISRPRSDAQYADHCIVDPRGPTTKRDAFSVGANDYIVKLPDKIELIARIHYHSQAYLSRRQTRMRQTQRFMKVNAS